MTVSSQSNNGAVEDKALSKDDVIDILSADDEVEDDKVEDKEENEGETEEEEDEEKEEDDKDDEGDEDDEEKESLKLDDDKDEELIVPVKKKEILKIYPDLFKKFPALERNYYLAQQFIEVTPTVEDAKEAVEKAEILDKFDADLQNGNIINILKAAKSAGDSSFNKLVDSYLDALSTVDKDSFLHVAGNILKSAVHKMVSEADNLSDEDAKNKMKEHAAEFYAYMFGTKKYSPPTKLSKKSDDSDEESLKLKNDREQFNKEKFESARDDLSERVGNTITNTIDSNIDKKSSMTSYVKRNAVRDAKEQLNGLITSDKSFSKILDSLWKKASEDNYSRSSLDNIRKAYLSKAKTLLPDVIKKARIEAMQGLGKRNKEDKDRKGHLPVGRTSSSSNNNSGKEKGQIPKGMSTRDFLMSD